MNVRLEHQGGGSFTLAGRTDFANVGSLLTDGQKQFTGLKKITIDLRDADCASTAGLALLLEWSTWCQARAIKLYYENPRRNLHAIVKVNDLEQVLSLSGQ